MYDLHTHTIYSDGVLLPSELVQRAKSKGYSGVAITDHVDFSNIGFVLDRLHDFFIKSSDKFGIDIIIGVEITHVPPVLIDKAVFMARKMGASLIVVHGETVVEPVEPGTNRAAIEAGVDILAHPGLIKEEDVELAVQNHVLLEVSTRKGHSYTNGHVVSLAKRYKAKLIINNDAHEPNDFVSSDMRKKIALGAGLSVEEYLEIEKECSLFFQKIVNPQTVV